MLIAAKSDSTVHDGAREDRSVCTDHATCYRLRPKADGARGALNSNRVRAWMDSPRGQERACVDFRTDPAEPTTEAPATQVWDIAGPLINAQGKGLATQYGLLTIGTRTLPSGDRQIATTVPPAKGEYYIRKVTLSG